nr:hypothetical protein HK105_002712 [Polyrhizophydium stewartii]
MVTTAALRHLKTMKAELKKRLRGYEGELRKLKSNVMRHRGQTISSITAHERNLTKRASALKANSGVSPGVAHTADPWLSERVLHYQLRVMIAGENKFQEDVLALIRDMAAFDGRIVAQLRGVMDEFSAARTSQWNLMQAFSSTHRLEEPKTWQHERTLDEFPYKVREIQILKHGLLHIPSRFSKNSWLPVVAVVTETGFFHCFKISSHKKLQLLECDVEPLGPEAVYKGLDHPSSAISISLSQSRMTIQLVPEKSHQHVFEIIIQHRRPRSGGLFSLWAKPTSDSWTRFEFKATTDNDLVEWLAVLQRKIQSYVPQGPPSPLFRSQQMIEQSVEAMIKEQHTRALTEIHSRESAPALAKFEPTIPARTLDSASTLVGTITKPAQSYGSASDALRDPVEQVKSLQASARLNASDSSLPTESGSQHFGQQLLAT